jgi:hypothetical protein
VTVARSGLGIWHVVLNARAAEVLLLPHVHVVLVGRGGRGGLGRSRVRRLDGVDDNLGHAVDPELAD